MPTAPTEFQVDFPYGWLLLLAVLFVTYAGLILRRNRRLVRPPILDLAGVPIPDQVFTLSDGETVDYVDIGPTDPANGADNRSATAVPTIFLVPGADGMKETFRFQVPALARGHRVVCASLRPRLSSRDTLDRMVDDVSALAEETGSGSLILLGQSLGGAIAMRFAIRYPERVAGLVLANSLARLGYEHVGLNRTLLAPLAMATTRYLPTSLGRAIARFWSRLEVWIYDASPGSERVVDYALWTGPRTVPSSVSNSRVARLKKVDLRPQLPAIGAPTLVLKGPRDHYVPPAWSHEIAALVPGAQYQGVGYTGHCSHVSMPSSFNALLLEWLENPEGSVAGPQASRDPGGPGTEVGE